MSPAEIVQSPLHKLPICTACKPGAIRTDTKSNFDHFYWVILSDRAVDALRVTFKLWVLENASINASWASE